MREKAIFPNRKNCFLADAKCGAMTTKKILVLFRCGIICLMCCCSSLCTAKEKTDVIFSSDLFHPYGDMDDQVDLVALYGMANINIKLIILDHGKAQLERPGIIPVSQLNTITGRTVRAEIGLGSRLQSQDDKVLDEPRRFQAASEALLDVMEKSSKKVVIITVGSLRDVAAAYNRAPALFHKKLEKIIIFAGEASRRSFIETNVRMDRLAFVAIMNSDLPIYWVPCFDGGLWQNRGKASYWQTTYGKILHSVSDPLLQYFLYSAKRSVEDPLLALKKTEVDERFKRKFFRTARNLWSCALFYIAAEKTVILTEHGYDIVSIDEAKSDKVVFDFVPVNIEVAANGVVRYLENNNGHRVLQFRIRKMKEYNAIMTAVTNDLMVAAGADASN